MGERSVDDWARRVRAHAGSRALSTQVVAELADHLAEAYAAHRRAGCTDAEAEARVLAVLDRSSFESLITRPRVATAESRLDDRAPAARTHVWTDVAFDVRYAWRALRRQPAFSAAVIAILAVAIGAATAAFGVIDTVLLRPLPYPDASQLFAVRHVTPSGESRAHATADWRDYAARNGASVALAAYASWPMNLTGLGDPERLRSVIVSGNFFDVLALAPRAGRGLTVGDDAPGAPAVAVLSYGFWQRRFGGDLRAIGQSITLNGRPVTIVGVTNPQFAFPDRTVDLWMPMALPPAVLDDRAGEWVSLIGRLQRGVDEAVAQRQLDATAASLAAAYPKTNSNERVVLRPLLDEVVGDTGRALWLGAVAAAFVLMVGCANAVNLMTARGTFRRDEIAIRSALGADGVRLARQLIVESVLLAAVGGVLGVVAASSFDRAFVALADGRVPRIEQLRLNAIAVAVAGAVSIGSGLMFGAASAWLLVRRTVEQGTRSTMRTTSSSRVGMVMLAAQVAFALTLTAGAVIVARSYRATAAIDPGFDTTDTLTAQLSLPRSRYADSASHVRFAERAIAEVSTIPGVESVGVVSDLPFVANALHFRVRRANATGDGDMMTVRPADGGFFRTLRVSPIAGRGFADTDRADAPAVALLNRSAADQLGGIAAIGQRIVVSGEPPRAIVGVVPNIKHGGLRSDEGPVVYVPFAQKTFDFVGWMGLVVRGRSIETSASAIRGALTRVDPVQPVSAVQTMTSYLDAETGPYRLGALIVFSLAAVALLLAVTGIYGMTAFMVGRQRRELGIRLALGASRAGVTTFVLRRVAAVVLCGSAVGAAVAAMTNTALQQALADVPTFASSAVAVAAAATVLLATALGAALVPAMRAGRIDPRAALQAE